ncbi:MAG: DNA recombination protein RmuC [Hyphomicrobiales bacterium]|nr:DNA recombination protein RmuC [Hyphomicrobiales bacterium]
METVIYALAAAGGVLMLALAFCLARLAQSRTEVMQLRADGALALDDLRRDLDAARRDHDTAQAEIKAGIAASTGAVVRLEEAEKAREGAVAERDAARDEARLAHESRVQAELEMAKVRQEMADLRKRMEDWEETRRENLQATKAAVLATANEISSKLLEDHKRESEAAKKESKEQVAKTTEGLLKQVDELGKSLLRLNDQAARNEQTMDTVWKALSSPASVGQFAEIGLENTLKRFGLEKGRDFLIQPPLDGNRLRPDALVLLPGDRVLVIDCKASSFVAEIARAEGDAAEAEAYANLARTMNRHLRGLADRHYRSAVQDAYRAAGRAGEIRAVVSVLYVPTDSALEKVVRADPEFIEKASKHGITVAAPAVLVGLLGFARVELDLVKQRENQEKIIDGTQGLLDRVSTILEHTEKVGRGIRSAATGYVDLTRSVNGRLLPKVRELMALGVRPSRNKPLPKAIPAYEVIELESGALIEGEAETVDGDGDDGDGDASAEITQLPARAGSQD